MNARTVSVILLLAVAMLGVGYLGVIFVGNNASLTSALSTQAYTTQAFGAISGVTWSYGCPAQQANQPCGSPYPYYPVAVYDVATGQLVTTVISDGSGHFSLPLKPGTYVVYTKVIGGAPGTPGNFYGGTCSYPTLFNPSWTGCASSPQYVTVTAGQTVNITVYIPNGIY